MQLFSKDSPFFESYLRTIKGFQGIVAEIEEFANIAKVVSSWNPEVMINSFFVATTPFKSGFKVLNHGDDWLNNLMFKIRDDDGSTEAVKLLDYQISYWGSPAGDLFYFLVSSVQDEFKTKHFDEFIAFYHSELVSSLTKLNFDSEKIPTLSELWMDLMEKRQLGELIASNDDELSVII
jgi:thiamine kinase-like enzyme